MTNLGKFLIALALVLGAFGTLAYVGVSPFVQVAQKVGSTVQDNTPWFTNGYKVGNSNALFNSASLTLVNGTDQASWLNNTGQPVVVDATHLITNAATNSATASTTYQISVGATSTATIVETNTTGWITSTLTPLAITNFYLATSSKVSQAAGNLLFKIQADNFSFHASSTAGLNDTANIVVPAGWYLFAKIDSNCAYAQAGITCELATSTNRGFTTITVPFWYHYSSPN